VITEPSQFPPDWDHWLAAQGANAGFCQTSVWAAIHEAVNGAESFVIATETGGVRVAGMLVSRRLAAGGGWLDRARAVFAGRGRGTLECFEGPVLPSANPVAALVDLLGQLDALAAELRVSVIRFAGPPPRAAWAGSPAVAKVFRDFGYLEIPWLTALVDLSQAEDALRAGLHHAARKGIRKCAEAGLGVTQCKSHDDYVRDFRTPYYAGLAAEGKRVPTRFRGHRSWWEIDGGTHYRFLAAKDASGAVHATLGTFSFNGMATEIMAGRSPEGRAANLPAQDLLHWEAFRIHKAAGDRWFNLAGFNPEPKNAKEAGIRRFKEKWGGREAAVPQFLRGGPPLAARIVRALIPGGRA
jgi:hypothetical protein